MIFRPSFFHGVVWGYPRVSPRLVVGTNPSGCFFVSQIGSCSPQFCGMKIKNRFEVSPPPRYSFLRFSGDCVIYIIVFLFWASGLPSVGFVFSGFPNKAWQLDPENTPVTWQRHNCSDMTLHWTPALSRSLAACDFFKYTKKKTQQIFASSVYQLSTPLFGKFDPQAV